MNHQFQPQGSAQQTPQLQTSPQILFQQCLQFIKQNDTKDFQQDSQLTQDITNFQELSDQLSALSQISPKYMSKNIDSVLDWHAQLIKMLEVTSLSPDAPQQNGQLHLSLQICCQLMDPIILLCESHPSLLRKNKNRVISIIERLFRLFNMVDFEVDQKWCEPEEGYSVQASQDDAITKDVMQYFDRLSAAYQNEEFVVLMLELLPGWVGTDSLIGNSNAPQQFKTPYMLLMIMSQLGQHIQQALKVKDFVEYAIKHSSNPNPKVRYAVLHMFGQLSDDMKPNFQITYGEKVLPIILSLCNDPIQRVRGHSMACITNFVEDYDKDNFAAFEPFIQPILQNCCNLLKNNGSVTKQNSISAMASIGTINLINQKHMATILEAVNLIVTDPKHLVPGETTYNQLLNQAVQCLTIVLYDQKQKGAAKYLEYTVSTIKQLMPRLSKSYRCNAWSRLCLGYQKFTNLADQQIFQKILSSVSDMVQNNEDEVESALDSVDNTIHSFKDQIKPYAQKILNFIKQGLQITQLYNDEKDLNEKFFKIIDSLITYLKNEAPDPEWEKTAQQLLGFLINQINNLLEKNPHIQDFKGLQSALKGPEKLIGHLFHLFSGNHEYIGQFLTTLMQIFSKINETIESVRQMIQQNSEIFTSSSADQFQKDNAKLVIQSDEQRLSDIYQARLVIPDIFTELIKVLVNAAERQPHKYNYHMAKTFQLVKFAHTHIEPYISEEQSSENKRYGLYYMCNIADIGWALIQESASIYEEMFCKFAVNEEVYIRNVGIYGLGGYMMNIPAEKINKQILIRWLNVAKDSLELTNSGDLTKHENRFAKDNIISAIGKLIFTKGLVFPDLINEDVYQTWLKYLPLNTDIGQGDIQQDYLVIFFYIKVQILKNKPELLIKDQNSLKTILVIFAKYFEKRKKKNTYQCPKNQEYQRQNTAKTKEVLGIMKEWPFFQQYSTNIWESLTPSQQQSLLNLMNTSA